MDLGLGGLATVLESLGWRFGRQEFSEVLIRMHRAYNENYGAEKAQEWGRRFFIDKGEVLARAGKLDAKMLGDCGGNLETMVKEKQNALRKDRMSVERVGEIYKLVNEADITQQFKKDISTLKVFAEYGVEIMVDSSFVPNGSRGPLSGSYKKSFLSVNAMLYEVWEKGLAIILPLEIAEGIVGIHFQNNGWAPKRKKEKGRYVGNCSGVSSRSGPQIPLNTEEVKLAAVQRWGLIHHPTVEEIAQMCLKAEALYGRENIVLWKMDLSGAYTLLFIAAECARLLAFEMSNGLAFIYIAGIFGWTGMPAAFEVATRVLRKAIGAVVTGGALMYVDDIIACSHLQNWKADMQATSEVVRTLLGSKSEAEDKRESTESGGDRALVCLGWLVDLRNWTIDVAEDNRLRALYVFWTVNLESSLEIVEVERLCSLAERYSKVYRELGILMGSLYRMLSGHNRSQRRRLHLSEESKAVILLWRAYLIISESSRSQGMGFGRPIPSFRVAEASWVVEFDGSLTGIGFRVFEIVEGVETLRGFGGERVEFDLRQQSQYQNSMEMAAMVIGLLAGAYLGASGREVRLRGDSVTVLEWATHDTFKSKRSLGAAMLLVALLESSDMVLAKGGQHIKSEDNDVCDKLSRGLESEGEEGLISLRIVGAKEGKIKKALILMNPTVILESEMSFISRWNESRRVVNVPTL